MFNYIKQTYKLGDRILIQCSMGEIKGEITYLGVDAVGIISTSGKKHIVKGTDISYCEDVIDHEYVEGEKKWIITSSRNFTQEEIEAVSDAVIVPSAYGNTVCFHMKTGGQTFIPLSNNSIKGVGEYIDFKTAKILTLRKEGENEIMRIKD